MTRFPATAISVLACIAIAMTYAFAMSAGGVREFMIVLLSLFAIGTLVALGYLIWVRSTKTVVTLASIAVVVVVRLLARQWMVDVSLQRLLSATTFLLIGCLIVFQLVDYQRRRRGDSH